MKKHLLSAMSLICRICSQAIVMLLRTGAVKLYQPIYGDASPDRDVVRSCEDRWQSIDKHLPAKNGSVYDIGCNLGYFTLRATEKGYAGWGVDHDALNVLYCRSIASAKDKKDVTQFLLQNLDLAAIEKLPKFDVIFNFSVFHHWVKAYGADTAQTMMKVLAQKCDMMFFETGQSNELGTKWAHKLDFMGATPDQWIQDFLKQCGFTNVQVIGTFATGLTNVDRYLYLAGK